MNDRDRAEEDLRVIRSLMERATVYRAISAPTALVGGFLALVSAVFIHLCDSGHSPIGRSIGPREFVFIWVDVLVITVVANTIFIWREAKATGRPFVSSGMKLALRAITPNFVVPMMFTIWFVRTGYLGAVELELVVVWTVFYGLALLSTTFFAPRSLTLLGWAVFLTSVAVPVLANAIDDLSGDFPNMIMGLTFGVYHLIYGVLTWTRPKSSPLTDAISE